MRFVQRHVAVEHDSATVASVTAGVLGGANIVRVHNVRDNQDAVKLCDAIDSLFTLRFFFSSLISKFPFHSK